MWTVINAARPVWASAQRFVAARRGARGLSTNGSEIGWGIGALVLVGAVLYGIHSGMLPWIANLFSGITGLSTTTTTTPAG
ncbi:MAG: hypothetical protein C7B45_17745 [Sulfobacillus acidophilus]|uniref:Uncharacterized protein n=1 Tax=Sulfobacillus acidophilus TaxID=53633 RepID=A0A2T2WCC4_9FIRM|nr:MAG: hypothetical protein C7B45_17745 [Sulfobacillus acidophilus]